MNNKIKRKLKHEPHSKFKGFLTENRILQKDVAKLLNLTSVSVNQKLNGTQHFTLDEVEAMCMEYKVMPQIFFTGELRNSNGIN